MIYAKKVDANQKKIVKSLRCIPGVSVAVTSSLGDGYPDLVIGYKGTNWLIELKDGSKTPSQQLLTDAEKKFKKEWKGQYHVCNSFDQIFNLVIKNKA